MIRIAEHLSTDILWFEVDENKSTKPFKAYYVYNIEDGTRIPLGQAGSISDVEDIIRVFIKGYQNAITANSKAPPAR